MRTSFYEAINKANNQKPKVNKVRKFTIEDKPSIEEQIQQIMHESAIINDTKIINNSDLVNWLYDATKKSEKQIQLEKKLLEEEKELNKLRDEARKKYNDFNRLHERAFLPSSSSNAAAGAGAGGGGRLIQDDTENTYVVNGYVQNYVV